MNPDFPVYIVSKGRWESRMTVKAFEEMKMPYSIVVEEQEYPQYCSVIAKEKVIVLDKAYQRDYDPFDAYGDSKSKGSGPARNFIWDHAVSKGAPWHWIVDDNINTFFRLNRNVKIYVADGTIFKCMEDFCLRYKNVGMAGPTYRGFVAQRYADPPFVLNSRIYSCNLIRNDLPFRWRGRYNEDTDLSLRILKAGWCTILFKAFLQGKMVTRTMKGGNTDELYAKGTVEKSKMIAAMHPDVCRLVMKYGRPHHYVNYRQSFGHLKLIKKDDLEISKEINDYGMKLIQIKKNPAS